MKVKYITDEHLYNAFVAACREDIKMEQMKRRFMSPERIKRIARAMRTALETKNES